MQRQQPDVRERLARHLFSTPPNGTPSVGDHTPISNDNLSNQIQEEQDHPEDEQDHSMDEEEHGSDQTSNGRADGKEFVGLTGKRQRCFKPHMPAYKDMTDIVHGYYKGIWTSASKADQSAKNTWFKEFGKLYYRNVSDAEMRSAFMTLANNHIRDVFKGHRQRGTCPPFCTDKQWKQMEQKRKTDPNMLRQAAVNKRNRASPKALEAGVYRGGSRKLTTWLDKAPMVDGKKPKISSMVRYLYRKRDGTVSGSLPAKYADNYDKLDAEIESQIESAAAEGIPVKRIPEKELWIKACDGPKHGRVFALGEEGRGLIRSGKVSTTPIQDSSYYESQVERLQDEIKDIRSTLSNFIEKQQQFQDTILQLLRSQGGPPSTSNVPNSNSDSNANPSS